MNNFKLGSDFDHLVNSLSDAELLNLFIQSCSQTTINGVPVPRFPPEEIQKQFVGASYEHALYDVLCKQKVQRNAEKSAEACATFLNLDFSISRR